MTEALFAAGVLTTATRVGFARHYDLTENVLPPDVVAREIDDEEAVRELSCARPRRWAWGPRPISATTSGCPRNRSKPAIAELVADGELEPVEVDGWPRRPICGPARSAAAGSPDGVAVPVRPADLLPAADRAALRLPLPHRDLRSRAKRQSVTTCGRSCSTGGWSAASTSRPSAADALQVVGAFTEPGEEPSRVAEALAAELRSMASWLGLTEMTVGDRGGI